MPRGDGYDASSSTILPPSNIDWSSILNNLGQWGRLLAMSPAYSYMQGQGGYTPQLGQTAPFPLGDAVYGQNPFYTQTPQGLQFNSQTYDPGIYGATPFNPLFGPDPMITGPLRQFLPYGGGSTGDIRT